MMNGKLKRKGPRRVPGLRALGSWYYFLLLLFQKLSCCELYSSIDFTLQRKESKDHHLIAYCTNKPQHHHHIHPTASIHTSTHTLPHTRLCVFPCAHTTKFTIATLQRLSSPICNPARIPCVVLGEAPPLPAISSARKARLLQGAAPLLSQRRKTRTGTKAETGC